MDVQHLLSTMICPSWTHARGQEHHTSLSARIPVHMLCEWYVFVRPMSSEPPTLCVLDARAHACCDLYIDWRTY
jgi:hypothetical protein